MIEKDVVITSRNGPIPAFAACPEGSGPYPGILFYMDAPGIREELRNLARRIAKHGYFCLLPDMYYRLGQLRFDMVRRADGMRPTMMAAMNSLTNALVTEDTAAWLGFLDAQDKVKPGPLGCVGHCMSGPFALAAAATFPRMKAAAALYGVHMVTDQPDSPHLMVGEIKGELYIAFAEVDHAVPPNVVPDLKKALDKAGTKYAMETVPNTHHGYCFAARHDYNAIAAEATWEKLFSLWQRNLK